MNPGRRILRGPLLPGLTIGQQNRLTLVLAERSALGSEGIAEHYSTADKHAANILSRYATDESLETRACILARSSGLSLATAAVLVGLALGLRLGVDWGHSNAVRNRHLQSVRRREREAEPAPPFDPVAAKAEHDAATSWVRRMGQVARKAR